MTTNNPGTNRLAQEKSPYLLQHAHNPVDWFPWNQEAFDKAKVEGKPIFLSIGYSTCHWCHVMERESFEDKDVADILNENFISIKVDREERPDIDHIYMTACQALTGHGGWPLTIIMTPDRKPFFAGTYFPKQNRMGMSGLMDILNKIAVMWEQEKSKLVESSEKINQVIHDALEMNDEENESISVQAVDSAFEYLKHSFDRKYGGFGTTPKFPTPHNLLFMLRYWKLFGKEETLDMVEDTLAAMHRGGIYDHIGFGFSRYSTDNKWLVPHFEKMLYDNALLAIVYLETYQITEKEEYKKVAQEIFEYVLREMTSENGGFFSAEDADSEGVEGKFYVWDYDEIIKILGEKRGQTFCDVYGITPRGNFEGKNIPNLIAVSEKKMDAALSLEEERKILYSYREKRKHPYKDDKILTSWNGLMIAALSIGARVLKDMRYEQSAEKSARFVLSRLINKNGRLLARYRDGDAAYLAYVDDYAFLIWGLIELYETNYDTFFLEQAVRLNQDLIHYFWDSKHGGLFLYGKDGEELIHRPKELYDGAMPSGNSVAAMNFLRLARITGNNELEKMAQTQFHHFGMKVNQNPSAYTYFLMAVLFASHPTQEIVLVGEKENSEMKEMISILHQKYLPMAVSLLYTKNEGKDTLEKLAPYIRGQKMVNGKPTAYLCENFTCKAPITEKYAFEEALTNMYKQ